MVLRCALTPVLARLTVVLEGLIKGVPVRDKIEDTLAVRSIFLRERNGRDF